jgi:hypothetical protein
MEIALPIIALGGLFIISNQKKQIKSSPYSDEQEESFVNMGSRRHASSSYLPNTTIPVQNYPVLNTQQEIKANTVNEYSTSQYPNPNTATDKYFDQSLYEAKIGKGMSVGQNPQQIYSLTGNYLDTEQFKHNNMKPFFGGKIKGYTYDSQIAESVMDNMTGNGSQVIKKIEQAPLFKPQENVQWAFGTPNNSDFFHSRVNPGTRNNNVKPFDTLQVGPGLDKGYGVDGSSGFNAGMEARDKWLPYTVDQLRVETNPKLEYELINHEGPAQSVIKNIGIFGARYAPNGEGLISGNMEKQKPDSFFINSQDRWLTTTGLEKGETQRPQQEMGIIKRNTGLTEYSGPAGTLARQAPIAPENYVPSRKPQLPCTDVPISNAIGRGNTTELGETRLQSFSNYPNHRTTVSQPDTFRSGFRGAIGAVIAPIMDFVRPNRKEETVENMRIYGDLSTGISNGYVRNSHESPMTTMKETTLYAPTFQMNNQKESLYVDNNTALDGTQRETTSVEYFPAPGGAATGYGDMLYESNYRQQNNEIKSSTIGNRPNQGGTQIFNPQMHVSINKLDSDRYDGRVNPPFSKLSGMPPSKETYGAIHSMPQRYNENAGCDRLDGNLLEAFKKNPYTHSLTNAV